MALEGSPTEEERAYIFERSPYRAERLRRMSSVSKKVSHPGTDGKDGAASSRGKILSTPAENEMDSEANYKGGEETEVQVEKDDAPSVPTFATHADLVEAFHAITGDPLQKDGGRIVVYRGNTKARLMIIGEAPGENEDIEGKPFVGNAGKLLDDIFRYGGFNMDQQVYVTNIAKRRPMKNRAPTPEEVDYYMPYLMEEIRLIDPKLIILAGGTAAQAFLGSDVKISKVRGQWFDDLLEGRHVMPIYHPSYLLRRRVAKYDMVTDIEEIRTKFMQLVPEERLGDLVKVSKS